MNNIAKKLKQDITLIVVHFFISAIAIFLIPIISLFNSKFLDIFIGVMFWFGFIVGIIRSYKIKVQPSSFYRKLYQDGNIKKQRYYGAFTFSVNKLNIVIYSIFLLGIIIIIIDSILNCISEFVIFPIISITFFMFVLHSVFDGIHYKIYKFMKEGNYNEV